MEYRGIQTLTIPLFLQPIWDRFHNELKEEDRFVRRVTDDRV